MIKIAVNAVRGDPARWTGMSTFNWIILEFWPERYDTVFIPRPDNVLESKGSAAVPRAVPVGSAERRSGSFRLLLGYLKRFLHDYRFARSQRREIGERMIILSSFGCETLPPAYRLAFPRNRLMLISHTHPGENNAARHPVRSRIERICAAAADMVVFNSHANRRLWDKKLGYPVRNAAVIHYGLPAPDDNVPPDYPQKPDGVLDFVYLAQFYSWKGQSEFLDAWAMALKKLTLQSAPPSLQSSVFSLQSALSGLQSSVFSLSAVASSAKADLQSDSPGPQSSSSSLQSSVFSLQSDLSGLQSVPRMRLIFIGDGARRAAAEARAAELGVEDSVIFLGSRPDGARYFNRADVAVLMSRQSEAFGFVLLEAMSRSKPVLASNIGGIPEVVDNGKTGLLADPCDTAGITEHILRMARDAELREHLGKAGEQRWLECFSVERMLAEYDKVLSMQ